MTRAEYKEKAERFRLMAEEGLRRIFAEAERRIYPRLREAMLYSIEAGGKRLRPCLMLAVCEMLCGDAERALPLACALEMIHTSSLIHDDLPCMDNDDMRRGRPSNHKAFGEATALLAGDALQAFAAEVMLGAVSRDPDPGVIRAAHEISVRAGAGGMLSGQAADSELEGAPAQTAEELDYIHRHKTADMLIAAVMAGAYSANADETTLAALRCYSEKMGLLFQITDDILDVRGDPSLMGKTLGKDETNGKLTYVTLLGVEEAVNAAKRTAEEAKAAIRDVPNSDFLSAVVDEMLVRSN